MILLLFSLQLNIYVWGSGNGTPLPCECPDEPFGGLSRRAGFIKTHAQQNSLFIETGDIFSPFPNYKNDSLYFAIYKKFPPDVISIGDQELIYGSKIIKKLFSILPFVSLNSSVDNLETNIQPFKIIQKNGIKIGITAIINRKTILFYDDKDKKGIRINDFKDNLSKTINELKKKCDLIILIDHGFLKDTTILKKIPSVDLFIVGHQGKLIHPFTVDSTFVITSAHDGKYFTEVVFNSEEKTFNAKYIPLDESTIEDSLTVNLIKNKGDIKDTVDNTKKDKNINNIKAKYKALLFYSPECDNCMFIKNEYLPSFQKKHRGLIHITYYSLDSTKNIILLDKYEKKFKKMDNPLPVMIVNGHLLGGKREIMDNLLSSLETKISDTLLTPLDTLIKTSKLKKEIVFFYSYGCKVCSRVNSILKAIKRTYPNMTIREFDVDNPRYRLLLERFGLFYNVNEKKRLLTPAVFSGSKYLIGKHFGYKDIINIIETDTLSIPWESIDNVQSKAKTSILKRYKNISIPALIGAGLLDGINPCAFATLIFFITYLSVLGLKRKKILGVAIPFIFAVFITYFFIGLFTYKLLHIISALRWISRGIILTGAAMLIVLAILSLYDIYLIKKGKSKDMKLQMSDKLKQKVHNIIKKKTTMGGLMVGTFITGVLVSIFELVCTGQVYLPTIIFVSQIPSLRTGAIFYLLLYNLAFILPLIIVFILVFAGMKESSFLIFLKKHLILNKVLTFIFFLVLGVVLLYIFISNITI